MEHQEAAFTTHDGVVLRGRLYLPPSACRVPGVVMSHGFSATIEMGLGRHAEAFAAAGFAVLLYDHRALGASDGSPRQLIDPFVQTRRHDGGGRLAGRSSAGGRRPDRTVGNQLQRRRDAGPRRAGRSGAGVVAVVPAVGSPVAVTADPAAAWSMLAARVRGATINADAVVGPRAAVPAVDASPGALMPDPDTAAWMLSEGGQPGSLWRNEVLTPAWSPERRPFDPAPAMPYLRAPVLLIAGTDDRVTPAADTRLAATIASDKAEFLLLEGHHCSFYAGLPRDLAAAAAIDFYRRRL